MSKKIIYGLGLLVVLLIIILFMGKSDKLVTSGGNTPSVNANAGAVKSGSPTANPAPATGNKAQGESPIFNWRTSQGMTPAAKPKSLTVFSTGRVVGDDVPGGEKDLGAAFAKTVARRIELEGLMTETCQTNDIADAGITYTLYSGGQKREIVNPRGDCATALNVLSGLIDQKLK